MTQDVQYTGNGTAGREADAQPTGFFFQMPKPVTHSEQEPVGEAYLCDRCQTPFDGAYECPSCGHHTSTKEPVYAHPPQRKPLSDEEILTYRHMIDWTAEWSYINFARAIEAAHGIKEKNTTP